MSEFPGKPPYLQFALVFIAGILATSACFLLKDVAHFVFVGQPIACQASFPLGRYACIYSSPGLGEQGITFTIDDQVVFSANDFPGGELGERITWDKSARHVTFHINGLEDKSFDAETKALK
jgi:hypothetical protein